MSILSRGLYADLPYDNIFTQIAVEKANISKTTMLEVAKFINKHARDAPEDNKLHAMQYAGSAIICFRLQQTTDRHTIKMLREYADLQIYSIAAALGRSESHKGSFRGEIAYLLKNLA